MFGIWTATVLSEFLEWVWIAAMVLAVVFFAIHYFKAERHSHVILIVNVIRKKKSQISHELDALKELADILALK